MDNGMRNRETGDMEKFQFLTLLRILICENAQIKIMYLKKFHFTIHLPLPYVSPIHIIRYSLFSSLSLLTLSISHMLHMNKRTRLVLPHLFPKNNLLWEIHGVSISRNSPSKYANIP